MRAFPIVLLALILLVIEGFRLPALPRFNRARMSRRSDMSDMSDISDIESEGSVPSENIAYKATTLSGIISEAGDFADPSLLTNMHARNSLGCLNVMVDSVPFAKKRLVTPQTIYSGLFDVLKYTEVPIDSISATTLPLQAALIGSEALLASNVSLTQLPHVVSQATAAAAEGLRRVVLGVRLGDSLSGEHFQLPLQDLSDIQAATEALARANIAYTVFCYLDTIHRKGEEAAAVPYRICGALNSAKSLTKAVDIDPEADIDRFLPSLQDLHRILSEVVDMAKSHNRVYGLRAGGLLDEKILNGLRTQGMPEREQVALLLGDIMAHVDQSALEEWEGGEMEEEEGEEGFDGSENDEDNSDGEYGWT